MDISGFPMPDVNAIGTVFALKYLNVKAIKIHTL